MTEQGTCAWCSQPILPGMEHTFSNMVLCPECSEASFVCHHCGNTYADRDSHEVDGESFCGDCVSVCTCCNDEYDPTNRDCWGDMCASCSDEHFVCDRCGDTHSRDDYGGDGYCLSCYEEENSGPIKEYHHGADCGIVFHPDREQPLYFGVELETDRYENRVEAAEALTDFCDGDGLFWLEEDGSLSNGIEIISQPCTLEYHRDQFPWKTICETVEKYGGRSHDTTTCGLHIHFNRTFFEPHGDLYQLRLIYLFEKFWDELVIFSRRDQHQLDTQAKKYDRSLFNCSAYEKVVELRRFFCRYQAVNIVGRETVEIRIFRGTLHVEAILASIELVDFLVRLARKTSNKRLQTLTWKNLVRRITANGYRYLPQYLAERGLT